MLFSLSRCTIYETVAKPCTRGRQIHQNNRRALLSVTGSLKGTKKGKVGDKNLYMSGVNVFVFYKKSFRMSLYIIPNHYVYNSN